MRREIEMPRLSDAVDEGVLVTWFVEPGATVREGDLVAEIQVEKTSSELRAPADGRLDALLAAPGDVVAQGAPIALLETGEASGPSGSPPVEPARSAIASADVPFTSADVPSGAGVPAAAPAPRNILASPAAKRLARELGVALASIAGSGPGGRIVEADVQAAASQPPGPPMPTSASGPSTPAGGQPLSAARRTIAARLRTSLATTAQLTLTAEADVTDLGERLGRWSMEWGHRASYTESVVRACALALRKHPAIAARWTDARLVPADRIDIGVAVALDDGLIVPVLRDADQKDLPAVSREIADLAERARAGTLTAAETEGGCFSVTNLGTYRIDAFTPLLNPPQTAILGVGRARQRPAVVDGSVVARTLVVLSLTFDHQVVDGAPAAAFLGDVVDLLEDPATLERG